MKYSIIVIVYNQLDSTKNCLDAIYRYTTNFELIIWNNGVSELLRTKETTIWLQQFSKSHSNVTVLGSEKNMGFTAPCNRCAEKAKGDYLLFVNNDVVVCRDWAEKLTDPFHNPKIGQTGIIGRGIGKDGICILSQKTEYIDGGLFAVPKRIYEEIGLFDENIEFAYVEDQDFSLKVQLYGYQLFIVVIYVFHKRATTRHNVNDIDFDELERKNRAYVQKKWWHYFRTKAFDKRMVKL